MTRNLFLLGALLLGLGAGVILGQRSPQDATVVDPDVHHIVLENEHVRILEVRAAPGHKSPRHTHLPVAAISLGSSRIKLKGPDGKAQILDLRPGTVLWMENADHSWELLAGDHYVVAVEVKAAQKAATK